MRLACTLAVVFFLLAYPPFVSSQNFARTAKREETVRVIEPPLGKIVVGEHFLYTVRWMGIPVGHASLEVKEETESEGHPAYHIVAQARSNKFLSAFYPLEDTIHTYVNSDGALFSWRYLKNQKEGRYRADEEMLFQHDEGKARYHSFLNGSTKWFEIPHGIHDPLSAFYAFRLMTVEPGELVHLDVCSDEKNWVVELKVGDTQEVELRRMGSVDCFEVEPIAHFKGILVDRGRVWVTFTADERRVPVLFRVETPWGVVTGTIKKAGSFP
ncbi:MAG: DUF3108 domain-containing protein [Candidatus Omnitrophica bacterium]|nr:DUF3108 domain-containing protein [Candidatus Omnitrophota bacterium]